MWDLLQFRFALHTADFKFHVGNARIIQAAALCNPAVIWIVISPNTCNLLGKYHGFILAQLKNQFQMSRSQMGKFYFIVGGNVLLMNKSHFGKIKKNTTPFPPVQDPAAENLKFCGKVL